jgi:ketosteroid isomerase-like protein
MSLTLPRPVATYLDAVKAKDATMLELCFADDAVVHDEDRDHRGLDAIKAWKQDTETKYKYVVEPLDVSVSGDTVKLLVLLTGEFPGSPIELDYTFTLANDKITSLEIS